MPRLTLLAFVCFLTLRCFAYEIHVYPSNWWVGMKHSTIEVMLRGDRVGEARAVRIDYPGVRVVDFHRVSNSHYLFVHLQIAAGAKPGIVRIVLVGVGNAAGGGHPAGGTDMNGEGHPAGGTNMDGGAKPAGADETADLPLLARRQGNGTAYAQGIRSNDFIYMLMPDRFSNGDPSNDRIPGLRDQSLDRDSIFLRHGGDFQGIMGHLDYLQSLGVTALWMTPVLENDMPNRTEHGYAFTDHYTIEPRLGGERGYLALSDALHKRGMKLIQDAVYNHVGLYHFLVQDLPDSSWLHQWGRYTQTNYRGEPLMDPHAAAIDRKLSSDGWFTREMPDLNQDNPDLADFLIQHAIWCVERFGVDGWRIDTYMYNSLNFMNRCNEALFEEYPHITMFGECWIGDVAKQAYFTRNRLDVPFKSNLPGVLDFQCLFNGIGPAVRDTSASGGGVDKLYQTLADDFLYRDPAANVIFLDNHDMTRFFSQTGEDVAGQKIGLEWLLTARGIPQLYYGTEVLMKGIANPDGNVRRDFPGGWPGDVKNAFTGQGMTADELGVQALVRKLGRYRLHSSALRTGQMMQYVPERSLYVYFRYDAQGTVLCAMNTGSAPVTVDFGRFRERTAGFAAGTDVITGQRISLDRPASLPGRTMWVLELAR